MALSEEDFTDKFKECCSRYKIPRMSKRGRRQLDAIGWLSMQRKIIKMPKNIRVVAHLWADKVYDRVVYSWVPEKIYRRKF